MSRTGINEGDNLSKRNRPAIPDASNKTMDSTVIVSGK